ncbi:dUTP diphosphatase [Acanthopleuribacter pedis]|uniref:Deoxyuridine 5'-triphosphate nucleotidohydrolase n=1 Tax=Acanthopleuribacter pedis TaxID=442870 RepID=A0A8J7QDN3_9BACT|nr:dUTP diphosphatase [Acanthopleuribacter pedis]MBO1322632.1 dUTP diphosphatase [Acanthopleuribacter pedis]
MTLSVALKTLPHHEGLPLPEYATALSAGVDLRYAGETPLVLEPGARQACPTGLCMALPAGYEAQVRPRSGLSLKQGLTVINSPGTIDADYRGEILVPLVNLGQEAVSVERGQRIAQLVVAPVIQVTWRQVEGLDETERGEGGFGHTGSR